MNITERTICNGPIDKLSLFEDGLLTDELYLPDLTEERAEQFIEQWQGSFGRRTLRFAINQARTLLKEYLNDTEETDRTDAVRKPSV